MSEHTRLKKILFTLVGLVLVFAAMELLVRLSLRVAGRDYEEFREYNAWVHRTSTALPPPDVDVAHPFLPFRPNPGFGDINSMGFRGRETEWDPAPGVLRIVCLGGSTTWDDWYPRAVEGRLNEYLENNETPFERCEVLNLGVASWTSMESLINYALRGVHMKPHILLVYHAINDAIAGYVLPEETAEPDYSHWRTHWFPISRPVWDLLPGRVDRSRLAGLVRYALNRACLGDQDPNQLGRCGIRYSYRPGMPETPFDTFGSNLSAMTAIALSRNTAVFLVSQYHMTELTVELFGSDELAGRVAALNDRARGIAEEQEHTGMVFFVDAASGVQVPRDLMVDNCHFTPEGYAVLGEYIADEMIVVLEGLGWELPDPPDPL